MRRLVVVAVGLLGAAHLACGGKGGSSTGVVNPPPGPVATFKCSDSPTAPNQVALVCGTLVSPNVWMIDVAVGVPTTSTDIGGFDFDVVFDPSNLAYVSGSAQLGDLFTQNNGDYLVAAATAPGDPGRLVVGISPINGTAGVAGIAGYDHILRFELRNKTISPWGPDLLTFENVRAIDSSGAPITSITFSGQLLLSLQ